MTITVTTSGFVTFAYTYYGNGEPATFWGITNTGDTVYATYNDLGEVLTYTTIPAPAKPAATSTAGTVNSSPVLYQAIGSSIPIIWGSVRVNGAQLWSSGAYNVAGIGNVVDVAVAWGTPLEVNGNIVNLFSRRLWGNSNLFYDLTSGGSSVGAFGLTDYVGDERQLQDPNLVLYKGANGTPAFRGLIYTYLKGLPLAPFNNSVDSTTFSNELSYFVGTYGRYTLSYVIDHLAQRAGFAAGAFTVSGNITDAMDGGQITSSTDFLTLLKGFADIYNFLILENPLRLKRIAVGGSLVVDAVISDADCISSSASDDVVLVSDAETWTIPNQVSLSYISAALTYQKATIPVKRSIFPFGLTGPQRIQTYDLPLVITDDEAVNLAWLYLYRIWTQSKTLTFTTMPKHADVEPGDVIQVTSRGLTYTAFVTRSTLRPDFSNAIIATALLTNLDVSLSADPGAVLPPTLVCPITNWTTLDGASAVGTTVSNCGLTATCTTGDGGARSLSFRTSGKYFFQMRVTAVVFGAAMGVAESGADFATPIGVKQGYGAAVVLRSGGTFSNTVAQSYNLGISNLGDVYSFAVDLDNMLFFTMVNSGLWNGSGLGNPATGAAGISMSAFAGQQMSPVVSFGAPGNVFDCNFGQSPFLDRFGIAVAVPSGFMPGWPI